MNEQWPVHYKNIELGSTKETADLMGSGSYYEGFAAEYLVWVAARKGFVEDWACYIQSPYQDGARDDIVFGGIKLHEDTARELFPDWANRFTYRP